MRDTRRERRFGSAAGCLLVLACLAPGPAEAGCAATAFGGARTLLNRARAAAKPQAASDLEPDEAWAAFERAVDGILGSDGEGADPGLRRQFVEALRSDAIVQLPCTRDVLDRDRQAYRLAMVGYSARDIGAVLLRQTTKALLDDAYRRRMAGMRRPEEAVAAGGPGVELAAPVLALNEPVADTPPHQPRPRAGGRGRDARPAMAATRARYAPPVPARDALMSHAREMARAYRVDVRLVEAVIRQESNWNPASVSKKGAVGLMQLMPATAALLGVNPHDPIDNIRGGVAYLADLLRAYGDVRHALIAYNAGPAHANRVIRGERPLYAETRRYLDAIAETYPL